jgi:leader peptidase (prepilin peptidase) / N-methyltransferase
LIVDPVAVVILTLLGLAIGSFLNVCIHRLPRRQSLVSPPSRCPRCGYELRWRDNIPVISYALLGGRCRKCRKRISMQYPIVELVTMGLFLLHYGVFDWKPLLAVRLLFACAMIVLFAIDLEHQILPDLITFPGIVAGLVSALFLPPGIVGSLLGAVAGGGVLFLIAEIWSRLRHVEAMGFGDVKMLAMVGAFLGVKLVILTFVLSSFIGGVAGGLLILSGRGSMASKVPFGTFLAVAALAASLWGDAIVNWYVGLYV